MSERDFRPSLHRKEAVRFHIPFIQSVTYANFVIICYKSTMYMYLQLLCSESLRSLLDHLNEIENTHTRKVRA